MQSLKIFLIFITFVVLSGCVQTTALLGPGITMASTGNIMHAGLQYGANSAIKKETGKDAITHLKNVMNKEQDSQKLKKKIRNIAKNAINKIKRKFLIN